MTNKYELTETTKEFEGKTLYRIRALYDFEDVHTGDLGGWVENEQNLKQEGKCWLYNEAIAKDNTIIYLDAVLKNNAIAKDNAMIGGSAVIKDNVIVQENSLIGDNAQISGNVIIGGRSFISNEALIHNY